MLPQDLYRQKENLAEIRLDRLFAAIARIEARGQAPQDRIEAWRIKLSTRRMSLALWDRDDVVAIDAQVELAKQVPPGTFACDRTPAGDRARAEIIARLATGGQRPIRSSVLR